MNVADAATEETIDEAGIEVIRLDAKLEDAEIFWLDTKLEDANMLWLDTAIEIETSELENVADAADDDATEAVDCIDAVRLEARMDDDKIL